MRQRPSTDARTRVAVAVALVLAAAAPTAAEENDLREFRVGMPASALPAGGYAGFACARAPERKLEGWAGWSTCPAEPSGLRAVTFRYDDAFSDLALIDEDEAGTKVAGHPVLLELLIADDATVAGLRIATDPEARLYLRKKAFLLGRQAMARFGEEGWRCSDAPPTAGETPLGGVFVKQHCEKTTGTRRYVVDRQLYRPAGSDVRGFVGGTQLAILRNG